VARRSFKGREKLSEGEMNKADELLEKYPSLEGCNTKIKMLKRVSYGLRNVEVYWRKMLSGFVSSRSFFHTI